MAPAFETAFKDAVERNEIPGVILVAADKTGSFSYQKTFGFDSLDHSGQEFSEDLLMYSASCTKLLTSVAFLKAVEQGLFSLDETVGTHLPELAQPRIMSKAEDDSFKYTAAKTPITYRHLLTHTSGLSYDFINPLTAEWQKENPPQDESVPEVFKHPLVFEPGTQWHYSCAMDWAGLAIERASGMSLEQFFKQHIFGPVGVVENGITFFPQYAHGKKMATIFWRNGETGSLEMPSAPEKCPTEKDCYGGQGTFARSQEYLKILKSLLADDEKLLKSESVNELFRPQLNDELKVKIKEYVFSNEVLTRVMSRQIPQDGVMDHGLGGIIDAEGRKGWRGKGTMMWGGGTNLTWFVDREKGLCGMMGTQLLPAGDPSFVKLGEQFEKGMYELSGKMS